MWSGMLICQSWLFWPLGSHSWIRENFWSDCLLHDHGCTTASIECQPVASKIREIAVIRSLASVKCSAVC
jgi:hypothetical protein